MTVAVEEQPAGGGPRRRRWVAVAVGAAVLAVLVGGGALLAVSARLDFAYAGPDGPVRAGDEVTVRTDADECGPLVVSLHRPTRLGPWSQTHSGNFLHGFGRDAHPWWSLGSRQTATPVPCAMGGATTFTLPDDLAPGVVAVCDQDRRCARLRVED